jgi:hypothetical protein
MGPDAFARIWQELFGLVGRAASPRTSLPIMGPDAFARIWQELFGLVGRASEPPNFLAHLGGNTFAIPISEIYEKNMARKGRKYSNPLPPERWLISNCTEDRTAMSGSSYTEKML